MFEKVESISSKILAQYLNNERLQVGLIVLSNLSTAKSAEVLAHMEPANAAEIVLKMGIPQNVSEEVVKLIVSTLLEHAYDIKTVQFGGLEKAKEIVALLSKELKKKIQEKSADCDEALADEWARALAIGERPEAEKAKKQPAKADAVNALASHPAAGALSILNDVKVKVHAELGCSLIPIQDILSFGVSTVVELDKLAGEPLDLYVNNKWIGRGESVVINEKFGIRIVDLPDISVVT